MLYIAGSGGNHLSRSGIVTVASEDASFPKSALYDRHCDLIYREATAGTDRRIYGDLNVVFNGGFESDLTNWTTEVSGSGTAAITTTAGEFRSGAKALECTGGSGFGQGYQDLVCRPGEIVRYDLWARIVTAGTARVRIYNPDSGNWWVGGAWQSTPGNADTTTSTSFVNLAGNVTVEPVSKLQINGLTRLRLYLRHDNATGSACFDDVTFYPHTNFLGVFGHNLPASPLITPKFQSSSDASAWTTQATMVMKRPAFYSYITTAVSTRYVGLLLEGTGLIPHYIAELLPGYARSPGRAMLWDYSTPWEYPAIRHVSAIGRVWASRMTQLPNRGLRFRIRAGNETDANEWIETVWAMSLAGQEPVVFVPNEAESPVYHGRLQPSLDASREFLTSWQIPLDILPSPMPIVGL